MVMEGDLTLGGEHTIQYADDVLYSCTPETFIILLTNVTPIKFNKFFLNIGDNEVTMTATTKMVWA